MEEPNEDVSETVDEFYEIIDELTKKANKLEEKEEDEIDIRRRIHD
jgi:hypothetical protein